MGRSFMFYLLLIKLEFKFTEGTIYVKFISVLVLKKKQNTRICFVI